MTELIQREYDGKWCHWEKLTEENQPEDYSSEWVCTGVYDFLAEIKYV